MAARLCKADLVSGMVYEFPELQGIMGGYYADNDGLDASVGAAIRAHYAPLGPSDDIPPTPEACVVALADKIDTLAGFWMIDEKPTGSKDPYALRRAALGVIRIVLEREAHVPLLPVFEKALALHGQAEGDRRPCAQACWTFWSKGSAFTCASATCATMLSRLCLPAAAMILLTLLAKPNISRIFCRRPTAAICWPLIGAPTVF